MAGSDRQGRRWWLIGLLTAASLLAATASADEIVLPDEVFFYHPVASPSGQQAAWINPAAIGYFHSGSMFIFTQRKNRLIRDWGAVAVIRMLSVAYRRINHDLESDHQEYIFALGGGQRTRIGVSYRYITGTDGYLNRRHLWNLALLVYNSERLMTGCRVENLNRGRVDGARSEIRFVYGIATLLYQNRITVTFDVDMTHKENLASADFRTGVEVRPVPGMYLYFDFDNHSRFNLGFRLNFGYSYLGHYHEFDRKLKSVMGTSFIGSVNQRQPSFVIPGLGTGRSR